MKRVPAALVFVALLLAASWLAWRSTRPTGTSPDARPPQLTGPNSAEASGTRDAVIRRPAAAILAANPATAMDELPDGELRRGLAALPEAVRREALARLAELRVPFNDQASLRVDLAGRFYYVCAMPPRGASADGSELPDADQLQPSRPAPPAEVAAAPVQITQPPVRHSRPGATRVAYLDFNGHSITGTAWNSRYGATTFVARPYDTDGSPTTFSDAEQAAIVRIWARVAEDFAAFDIDVTTEEPAVFTTQTARILITRSTDANGVSNPEGSRAGGVAYLDVFGRDGYAASSPAFVYYDNLGTEANIAEAASHELGHNLALAHDGTTTLAYYGGHGTGETSWGPIMGTGYGRNISQWSKGEYLRANNTQDDIAILASRLTFRPDDGGDTRATARPLTLAGATVSGSGVIERPGDADRFSFTTAGGTISLTARPVRIESGTLGGNLDVLLELYDSAERLVTSANPTGTLAATLSTNLPPGDYTLRVSPTGVAEPRNDPPSGYTAYGSAGAYTISGTVPPVATAEPPSITTSPQASTVVVGGTATFTVVARGAAPLTYQWTKGDTPLAGQTGSTLTLAAVTTAAEGLYAVTVTNPFGSATSSPVALTVVPAALAPTILAQPVSQAVTAGTTASLSVEAGGTAPFTYQWRRNGITIPGATGASLTFAAVVPGDAGSYSVVVTNVAGAITSRTAVLTIYAPPVFTRQPTSRTAVPGSSATFTVEATAVPAATLRWQRSTDEGQTWGDLTDGSGVSGAGTATLTLSALTTTSSGLHLRAVASNSVGATASDPAVLTVAAQPPVTAIATADYHTLYLKADGTVWASGDNDSGAFGNGATGVFSTPVQVANGATAVAAGSAHSLMLKADGTLWVAGLNGSGQLGDGTLINRDTWVRIATDVSAIAARGTESAFIRRDGTLWTMGRNAQGQLGDGTTQTRSVPVRVASGVRTVSLGSLHLLYVDWTGTLYAAGSNSAGQLGDGTLTSRLTPIPVADGVTRAVAGYAFSAYLRDDGRMWGMGQNNFGQLGDGTQQSRLSPVSLAAPRTRLHTNFNHLLALDGATGQLFGAGSNTVAQLDQSGLVSRSTPVVVATSVAVAEAGYFTSHWVTTNGTTMAVGRNLAGQLGDGSTTDRLAPVEIFVGVPAAAGTPTGLSATDGTVSGAVRLTWNHLAGAPRYEVWRHTANNSAAATRLASDEPANFFEDRTGIPSVTYFYWVRAVGLGGPGGFSDVDTGYRVPQGSPPTFVTPPAATTLVESSAATLTVVVSGDPRPTLQWQRSVDSGVTWGDLANDATFQGTTTDSLRITAVPLAFSGHRYRVVANNTAGRTTSASATLTVTPAPLRPTITQQPLPLSVDENAAATFTVTASGPGPLSYQWRRNSVALSGATSATLTIGAVQFADAGTYDVVVTNAAGSTTSNGASLIVTTPGLISPARSVVSARQQAYTVAVNTSGPWTVQTSLPWVTVTPTSGTGRASITVLVAEHTGRATRTGTLTINGVVHTVTQLAPNGLDQWVTRNPLPGGHTLRRVIWDGSRFLAVGERGAILTSPDGATWTARDTQTTDFYGVVRGNGLYVAVGALGRICTSTDGLAWTLRTSPNGLVLNSVAWNGSLFVAVGVSGTIITSADGNTWTVRSSGVTTSLRYVLWAGGRFLAVGDSGVILSSTDGATWVAQSSGTTSHLLSAGYNGTHWVAAGFLGTVLTSPDGVTWTSRSLGGSYFVHDILWDGTAFVASASQGRVLTSPDGVAWTIMTTPAIDSLHSLVWNGERYVAVGIGGHVVSSPNRSEWTLTNSIASPRLSDIVWNGRLFVAVGDFGTIVTSPDGTTWTSRPVQANRFLTSVAWSGTRFVAVTDNGGIFVSTDGISWSTTVSPTTSSLFSVTWTGTRFVAVGRGNRVLTSADGLSWTQQGTGITSTLYDVVWTGELHVAVGDLGKIYTSPDALTWTERTSPTTLSLFAVEWNGSILVAVGANGAAANSPDGITWTSFPVSSAQILNTVRWNGTHFVAMGSSGYTLTSPDGVNWVAQIMRVPTFANIYGLACTADRFVAIGSNGLIIQAVDLFASEPPQIELHPLPQTAPTASTVSFRVVARATPLPQYQWYRNGTPISNASSDRLVLQNISPTDGGAYSVVVTNSAGSATSNPAALTILSGYGAWVQENFSASEAVDPTASGPQADPDADGLTNLLEYALGLAPKATDATALPQISLNADVWEYTYTRPIARSDLTYAVEVSLNLNGWTTTGVIHELLSSTDGRETWRARYPRTGAATVFFRLKITQP